MNVKLWGVKVRSEFTICPLCKEIPEGEIFQCSAGHIICDQCYSKAVGVGARCPTCNIALEEIRARIFEAKLNHARFQCKFLDCNQVCNREQIKRHENSCSYNPATVALCEEWGIENCKQFRVGCISREDVLSHFEQMHHNPLKISDTFNLCGTVLQEFLSRRNNKKLGSDLSGRALLCCLIRPEESGPLFQILGKASHSDGVLSFLCVKVWESDSQSTKSYRATFSLHKSSKPTPLQAHSSKGTLPVIDFDPFPVTISMNVCSVQEARFFMKNVSPANFPLTLLYQGSFGTNEEDFIRFKVSVADESS